MWSYCACDHHNTFHQMGRKGPLLFPGLRTVLADSKFSQYRACIAKQKAKNRDRKKWRSCFVAQAGQNCRRLSVTCRRPSSSGWVITILVLSCCSHCGCPSENLAHCTAPFRVRFVDRMTHEKMMKRAHLEQFSFVVLPQKDLPRPILGWGVRNFPLHASRPAFLLRLRFPFPSLSCCRRHWV